MSFPGATSINFAQAPVGKAVLMLAGGFQDESLPGLLVVLDEILHRRLATTELLKITKEDREGTATFGRSEKNAPRNRVGGVSTRELVTRTVVSRARMAMGLQHLVAFLGIVSSHTYNNSVTGLLLVVLLLTFLHFLLKVADPWRHKARILPRVVNTPRILFRPLLLGLHLLNFVIGGADASTVGEALRIGRFNLNSLRVLAEARHLWPVNKLDSTSFARLELVPVVLHEGRELTICLLASAVVVMELSLKIRESDRVFA